MELLDFLQLNLDTKSLLVLKYGCIITTRTHSDCQISLYYMGDFFSEVLTRDNLLVSVNGFKSKNCLDPYLDMVDISDIMR